MQFFLPRQRRTTWVQIETAQTIMCRGKGAVLLPASKAMPWRAAAS
jgi:hypothetical protein